MRLFHNDKIDELNEYILFLKEVSVDAIVFGDPAVLMAVREIAPEMKLHGVLKQQATNWYYM